MSFELACSLDELWEGEMREFTVGGMPVLLIHAEGGHLGAFSPLCPHQEFPLVQGLLEGRLLTCSAHMWEFDAITGKGVNPDDCVLTRYPVKVENEQVFVDVLAASTATESRSESVTRPA